MSCFIYKTYRDTFSEVQMQRIDSFQDFLDLVDAETSLSGQSSDTVPVGANALASSVDSWGIVVTQSTINQTSSTFRPGNNRNCIITEIFCGNCLTDKNRCLLQFSSYSGNLFDAFLVHSQIALEGLVLSLQRSHFRQGCIAVVAF